MDRLVTYEAIDHFVVVAKRSPNIGIDTVRHTFIIAVTYDCELKPGRGRGLPARQPPPRRLHGLLTTISRPRHRCRGKWQPALLMPER